MPRLRAFLQRHEAGAYFVLAFGLSWLGVLAVTWPRGIPAPADQLAGLRPAVFLAMLLGPSASGLALIGLLQGRDGFRALLQRLRARVEGRWAITLLLAPVLLLVILVPLGWLDPAFVPPLLGGQVGPDAALVAIVGGLGAGFFEELGWTGFATPALRRHHGVVATGVILGLAWGFWHLLADYWGGAVYGSLWAAHFLEWVVALASYRLVMSWVYEQTRSLFFGQLMHAVFTGSQLLLWPSGASVPEELAWYGLFAAALAFTALMLALRERPIRSRWRPRPS